MSWEPKGANKSKSALLLPTLVLCSFVGFTITAFLSTLLVDLAESFKISIGTASELVLISSLTGLIVGVAMSAFSIKFKHRFLFLGGISVFSIGTFGFFLAQSFGILVFSQFLVAAGSTILLIITYTLIGDEFPLEERGWAIGLLVSGGMAAFIIVAPLSGIITNLAGWRSVFLWFIIPTSLVCVALSLICIPSNQSKIGASSNYLYVQAYKRIFLCKSTVACLISTTLVSFISVVPMYAYPFTELLILCPLRLVAFYLQSRLQERSSAE